MAGSHEDRTLTQAARPAARARPVAEPLPLVAQRYRDVSLLGRGGMGEVRRVIDERLERPVAMKILHAGHEISEEGRALFLAEARLTARLQHPGVVAVHDVGELPDGRLWFTMAEIEGRTLAAAQAEGDLTFRRLVDVLARVATVVAYAHARHVVHLDVKPSNIMLGPFGEVYLVDWGISALVRRQGQVAGSPAYMSPEQARGDATGPATDVYALGLILRELLTGESAPPGTASELVARAAQGPPPPLPEQPLDRTELGELVAQILVEAPTARPPAREVLVRLEAWLDGARSLDRARQLVHDAEALRPVLAAKRKEIEQMRADAAALLAALPPRRGMRPRSPPGRSRIGPPRASCGWPRPRWSTCARCRGPCPSSPSLRRPGRAWPATTASWPSGPRIGATPWLRPSRRPWSASMTPPAPTPTGWPGRVG
ncbi:MAG: protein kinase [bacterium]